MTERNTHASKLFRSEALEAKRQLIHNRPLRSRRQLVLTLLAVGALILAASVSTIFLLFSVETIHADGIVVSSKGIIAVRQKKLGIVQRVDVTEGQKVSVGDRLLLVASDRADEENNSELTSRRLIKDLDEKFLIQKKEIISEELRKKILISQSVIDVIAHDKTKSELMLENVLKRKRALELSRERYQKIAEKGYISDAQLAERELAGC